jgi:hypothetical protein
MMQQMQQRMFAMADQNADGGIDQAEMQEMADMMAERTGQSVDDISERFSAADANGDGLIDETEFAAMKPPEPPAGGPPGKMSMSIDGQNDTLESLLEMLDDSDDKSGIDLYA